MLRLTHKYVPIIFGHAALNINKITGTLQAFDKHRDLFSEPAMNIIKIKVDKSCYNFMIMFEPINFPKGNNTCMIPLKHIATRLEKGLENPIFFTARAPDAHVFKEHKVDPELCIATAKFIKKCK